MGIVSHRNEHSNTFRLLSYSLLTSVSSNISSSQKVGVVLLRGEYADTLGYFTGVSANISSSREEGGHLTQGCTFKYVSY